MSQTGSFTEDSEEVEQTEECCVPQTYSCQKHMNDRTLYRNSRRSEYCFMCEQPRQEIEIDRRRRSKKNQLQYCRRCKSPLDTLKPYKGRVRYGPDMNAVLKNFEETVTKPKQCVCYATGNEFQHARRRHASVHRHRSEQNERISGMTGSFMNSGTNDAVENSYKFSQITKNGCRRDGHWVDYQTELLGNSDLDNEAVVNCKQHRKERVTRSEPRVSRMSKLLASGKNESMYDEYVDLSRKEEEDWARQLKFNECEYQSLKKASDILEESRKDRLKMNLNSSSSKLIASRSNSGKASCLQTLKNKHAEKPTRHKSLTIDVNNYSEDDELRKSRKRSTVRQDPACKSDEESTNKEEVKEDTQCALAVKDDEEEDDLEKNVYAGGDLHATKARIVELIDKVLKDEFGTTVDQPKNADSTGLLRHQEFCIEITRALQGDNCQSRVEDLSSHREKFFKQPEKFIKQLKLRRWEHMNHIQDEFKKLCSLQKLLDKCSPRPSVTASQTISNAIEQRPEDRPQQQHEEKLS